MNELQHLTHINTDVGRSRVSFVFFPVCDAVYREHDINYILINVPILVMA